MTTTEELQAKLDEYKASEQQTNADREEHEADQAAEAVAIAKTTASRAKWIASLTRQHELDDEFDALSAAHEPPALP